MEHRQELGVEEAPLPLQPGSSPALPFGLVWMRARILALVNSATLTVNYGIK